MLEEENITFHDRTNRTINQKNLEPRVLKDYVPNNA